MKNLDPDYPVFEVPYDEDDEGKWELMYEKVDRTDRDGREYEFLGQFLEDSDFYRGLNRITVARRKSDGKLFGYSWWDDISKHGEAYVEANADDFGIEQEWVSDEEWVDHYVFEPVEEYSITAYRKSNG